MIVNQDKPEYYKTFFEQFEKRPMNKELDWIRQVRREAMDSFMEKGFPTARMEDWRQTNIAQVIQRNYAGALPEPEIPEDFNDISPYIFSGTENSRLIFVNGVFSETLSKTDGLPQGVQAENIFSVCRGKNAPHLKPDFFRCNKFKKNSFTSLNTAFFGEGFYLYVPDGTVIESPIHVLYLTLSPEEPVRIHPRNLFIVGKNAQVSIIESYAGVSSIPYFTNAVTTVFVGKNSTVDHYKIQQEAASAYHISDTQIELERNANYTNHNISFGGLLTRNELTAMLDGEGVHCVLNGLYMPKEKQHVDNRTLIVHEKPHSESHELYKGILSDESKGVFRGRILVQKDAQKTDAKQDSKVLLLSGEAEINAMPQLEIYADDVKCSHGATSGYLEDDSIFYLQSRGIPKEKARGLLTYAFACDLTNRIKIDAVRQKIDSLLQESLAVHL